MGCGRNVSYMVFDEEWTSNEIKSLNTYGKVALS
jgi:hypothetical protein